MKLRAMALVVVVSSLGCGSAPTSDEGRDEPSSERAPPERRRIPRVAVVADRSTSREHEAVPPVDVEDLQPLLELIDDHGGELLLGVVDEAADEPLLRVALDPPRRPVDEADVVTGNAFDRARQRAARARREEAERGLRDHDRAIRDDALDAFVSAARGLLGRASEAPSSDVLGALARVGMALAEPSRGGEEVRVGIVLVSDMVHAHRRRSARVSFPPDAVVAVVGTATAERAAISGIHTHAFDSVRAATEYVASQLIEGSDEP